MAQDKDTNTRKDGEPDRRGAEPGSFGQEAHTPTQERRNLVRIAIASGMTQEAIAATQFDPPISVDTLAKYYREDLDHGAEVALSQVASVQFSIATNPKHKDCAKTGEFILRARAGWRTRDEMTHRFRAGGEGGDHDDKDVTPSKITVEFVTGGDAEPLHDTTGK